MSNTTDVLACVRAASTRVRTFAIGVGSDVSHYLVNGIAKAGKGTAAFAALNERLESKVQRTLQNALQPAMTGEGESTFFPAAQQTNRAGDVDKQANL